MNNYPKPGEVSAAYEALRSQATGRLATVTPRGLSLVLGAGLPAWVKAWAQPAEPPAVTRPAVAPSAPAVTTTGGPPTVQGVSAGTGGELVRLLAEMALGCWAKLAVAT
jgi:hypothetical protein